MGRNKNVYSGIYEVGVYPRKTGKETQLFAYLIPQNPFSKKKIIKLTGVKEVEIYEGKKLKERYTGKAPARTVRMDNGECRFESNKLICTTDHIVYLKDRRNKRGGR